MATEPRQSGDPTAAEEPKASTRHQLDPSKAPHDDAAADEAASQQQQ